MAENVLKEKLRAAQATGDFKLASTDNVAASGGTVAPVEEKVGDVVVTVPEIAKQDPLINNATGVTVSGDLSKSADKSAGAAEGNLLAQTLSALEVVTITDGDRQSFLDALISGERYHRPFSLFGGKVQGILRCRSAQESEAIANWISSNLNAQKYGTAMAYAVDLRNALMAAQVQRLNGTEFVEFNKPLFRTQDGATTTPPGWIVQAERWGLQPEAILGGLYEELRTFERKYWTMIENAANQDFWVPVGSI